MTHINDDHIDTAENLDIIMPMHNLIEYSDNYSDISWSLWQFKRDESPMNSARNPINVAINNSASSKYKSSILGKATTAVNHYILLKYVKIAVPLKYLTNFWDH